MRGRSGRLASLCGLVVLLAACCQHGCAPGAEKRIEGKAENGAIGAPVPASHVDPIAPVLLGISIILLSAKVGGDCLVRCGQPAVLGELLAGVVLGNLALVGFDGLEFLRLDSGGAGPAAPAAFTLDMLAQIGVILLLFEIGLGSRVHELRQVGWSSLAVAVLGVVTPMGLGWLVGRWLLPDESWHVHLFIGATLCATSVGITARVFKDLGKTQTPEARIVLGAAVIDDVLGLVVLAVVQALILEGSARAGDVLLIVGKAAGFLIGAVVLGKWLSPRLFGVAAWLRVHGMLIVTGVVICFLFSWSASLVGLAPIVGAFAAGLIIDATHFQALSDVEGRSLEDLLLPLSTLLVPIFFVTMGFQVSLATLSSPKILLLAAGLTAAAVAGKQACALGVFGRGLDRISVGIGMIPRGEVGLIFAAIGKGLMEDGKPVLAPAVFAAIVVMVMATTLLTPPLLSWSLRRKRG